MHLTFSITEDVLSVKVMCLLMQVVPDHKTKSSLSKLITYIPVSISDFTYTIHHSMFMQASLNVVTALEGFSGSEQNYPSLLVTELSFFTS